MSVSSERPRDPIARVPSRPPASPRTGAALLTVALLTVAACGGDTDDDSDPTGPGDPDPTAPELFRGFGLSPRGFPASFARIPEFFDEVASIDGGGVTFTGVWRDDLVGGTDSGDLPEAARLVFEQAGPEGYRPMAVLGWASPTRTFLSLPGAPANDWTNGEAADLYESVAVELASTYEPGFLFLGNENSFYLERNPTDYARWIEVYERVYSAVKAVSPETRVGPVFNFEHLAGQGALNGWTTPRWEALDAHSLASVDVVGITLYPFLDVASASDIPDGYLNGLLQRIGSTPLAITETGWPAEDLDDIGLAWNTSESEQLDYVERLGDLLEGVDLRVLNWPFLYELTREGTPAQEYRVFGSVSLRRLDGTERPAYDAWLALDP